MGDVLSNYASGDLVLLGPDLPHMWRSESSSREGERRTHRAIVVQFRPDALGVDIDGTPELGSVRRLFRRAAGGLQIVGSTRDDVTERMGSMESMSDEDRWLELIRILMRTARGGGDVTTITDAERLVAPAVQDQKRFDRVFAYIEDRLAEPIAQADVAEHCGLSPAGFSRFFRRVSGKTFVGYLTELRIRRACRMLVETEQSVLEVSLRAGFRNLSNFNRAFRRVVGTTPREYRRRGR